MKKTNIALISVVSLLIIARAILPVAVQRYVNRTLDKLPDYDGHIGDVDIHLYRGAYEIEDIEIVKTTGDIPVPFFKARSMDLSVEWKQLLNGALVGEILFLKPQINVVSSPTKDQVQMGKDQDWVKVVKDLFPIKINRLEIEEGSLHYRDYSKKPEVDVYLSSMDAVASNLTNSEKVSETMLATIVAHAKAMEEGNLDMLMRFNPYNKQPTYDINMELKDLPLKKMNNFFRHYAGIDVEAGTFSVYMEAAAKNGSMEGYVKPFFKDLDVIDLKKEELSFIEVVKEGFIELVGKVFKNRKQQTTATRIPFKEEYGDTDIGIFSAVISSFRHALFKALQPNLEDTVDLVGKKKKKGK